MRPNQKLIAALRSAADDIEARRNAQNEPNPAVQILTKISLGQFPDLYLWRDSRTCNCGVLAQHLLKGISPEEFYNQTAVAAWSDSRHFCQETGLPLKKIHQALSSYGLESQEDFRKIEYLIGSSSGRHTDPIAASQYFRKLADDLETQLQEQQKVLSVKNSKAKVSQPVKVGV